METRSYTESTHCAERAADAIVVDCKGVRRAMVQSFDIQDCNIARLTPLVKDY